MTAPERLPTDLPLFAEIVDHAPGVTLLFTSRYRIDLPGVWVIPLQGLICPEGEHMTGAENCSGVELFLATAHRMHPDFAVDAANLPFVGEICRRVDGNPLALELAAAWTGSLPAGDRP